MFAPSPPLLPAPAASPSASRSASPTASAGAGPATPPTPAPSSSAALDGHRARWPFAVLVVVVVGSMLTRIGPGWALVVGFAVAVPIERIWRRHDFGVRRPGLRTDAFHLMFTGAMQTAALIAAVVVCMIPMWPLLGNPLAQAFQQLPTLAQAAIGLVAFEVMGYWYHRLSHEVPFLWRFHAVHHSSERLDWIAAARLHPLEGFFAGLVVAPPLLLLGVRPTTLGVLGVVTQLWAITLHMNVRWRMRWLDGIWGTPEYHHWHHSNHPEAHDRNYSGLLPILDIAFGTYYQPEDRRPQVYGIDDPMPDGYLAQLAQPFRRRRRPAPPTGPADAMPMPAPSMAPPPVPVPPGPPMPSWAVAPGVPEPTSMPVPVPVPVPGPLVGAGTWGPSGWVPPGHPGPGAG